MSKVGVDLGVLGVHGRITGKFRPNDSLEQVYVLNDCKILVVDGSDPKSDPSVATHTTNRILATDTTNGISTRKLYPLFIKPAIQAVV